MGCVHDEILIKMKGKTQKRHLMTFLHTIFHIWPNGKMVRCEQLIFLFIYFHDAGFILSWMLSHANTTLKKSIPSIFSWAIALNCLKSMLCDKTIFIWNNSLNAERVFFFKNWLIFIITQNILSLSVGFVFCQLAFYRTCFAYTAWYLPIRKSRWALGKQVFT